MCVCVCLCVCVRVYLCDFVAASADVKLRRFADDEDKAIYLLCWGNQKLLSPSAVAAAAVSLNQCPLLLTLRLSWCCCCAGNRHTPN